MKRFTHILTLLACLACSEPSEPTLKKGEMPTYKEPVADFSAKEIADLPIHFDSTNVLLHPIGSYTIEESKGSYVRKSIGKSFKEYSVAWFGGFQIQGNMENVLFENIASGKRAKLTDKELHISCITLLVVPTTKQNYLLYEVYDQDSNEDGILSSKDQKSLYLSSIEGKVFQKLHPSNQQVLNWNLYPSLNRLYFRTIEDSNKDGETNHKDKLHYQWIDLAVDLPKPNYYTPL